MFKSLKDHDDIKEQLNKIFLTQNDSDLIDLINKLEKSNEKYKNSLTGKNAVTLNALLYINNPNKYISCISLDHRSQIMKTFGLGNFEQYKSYGEKIIKSNSEIIYGFREKFGINITPRALSVFFYSPVKYSETSEYSDYPGIRSLWLKQGAVEQYEQQEVEGEQLIERTEFSLEKHLEDFLVSNWENTELGKKFELIEEEGDIVSPQYLTDVGKIDLLVRDKETKQFIVIELKKGQTSDDTIGQLARYMGWIKENLAGNKDVRGIIIASTEDKRLNSALKVIPNCELLLYRVNFSLEKPKMK